MGMIQLNRFRIMESHVFNVSHVRLFINDIEIFSEKLENDNSITLGGELCGSQSPLCARKVNQKLELIIVASIL